ncbi:bifunctional glycosyltransferase/CDP-glycerol:glycerophosphate glycerophosphotransferase [Neobacillus mesonae]|uniref:bifunctional glycosyltransferase/CDP-glycerol:glycerophosphate glycerophosphotransferase n=1 Tax=Neobacillus mesonae TaxID=1193713 RepID=UPI000835F36B|nr:CDP-glycerol:glycerophosphate glycerophosphotransferase [Neobacillus mesonae]
MITKPEKKVSIIIPYYNSMEFIGDCLDSVIMQSYTNLEIIIINDGSDFENTQYIKSQIQDSRIIFLENPQNKGVAFSRNKGLNAVTGDYVFFLDSDDFLAENAVELLLKNIQESPLILGETKLMQRPSDIEQKRKNTEVAIERKVANEFFEEGSILNVLIKSDFIRDHNIKFNEETKGYTDISGIVPLLLNVENIPNLKVLTYYKRVRNDPITNPSLIQRQIDEKTNELIEMYHKMDRKFGQMEKIKMYLDSLFLGFYRSQRVKIFEENNNFDKRFELIESVVKVLNPKIVTSQPIYIRRELKQLMIGDKVKFLKAFRFNTELRDIKNAVQGFTRLKKYIYKKFFLRFPLKDNYIIFESFLGKNYSDSPRNIYEYIMEHNLDYKCIWVFNDKNKKIPGNAKIVKRFSLAYYYYFAVSKYWVNNMRQPLHLIKREGNVFLETWHGTPLKKLVFDMKDVYSANPRYKSDFYLQSRAWDFLVSPNQYSSEIFKRAFKFNNEMLEYGYPRNDILYSARKDEISSKVKKSLGIPEDKKVILYAPTWRDDEYYEPGKYKFQIQLNLKKMKEELGDKYVVALRMHYFIADDINVEGLEGFAFNLSKYDDIAELYLISDILITDYSSVFFDYANLKRPILFYTYDLEKYRDQLRGFYLDFEKDAPGPLLTTSDAVIDAINNIDTLKMDYADRFDKFYEIFCSWHDGKATEKVVNRVFLKRE